jgi:transcriptional regulator with XRE-family HTH domain
MLGNRLRTHRVAGGYPTARELASALGVEENTYTRWERDETEPSIASLLQICRVLKITPTELLVGELPELGQFTNAGQYRHLLASIEGRILESVKSIEDCHRSILSVTELLKQMASTIDSKMESSLPVTESLKSLRKRAGLTMEEIATGLGYRTASGYQRYEDASIYKKKYIPMELAEGLARIWVGKGKPEVRREEIMILAGVPNIRG